MADGYIISAPDAARRSIYFEMVSNGKDTLKAGYDLSYTSYNQYFSNLEEQIQPYDTSSLIYKTYTAERERHIVFTDKIKTLADSLVGEATEPYEKVKRIWCWITENIPWAGARDYSTIPNIPMYVLNVGHGDCGQVSLLFMTMARYKGIPARWQSGWMVHPGHVNLHDWAEVYYEGVGWVPVDQSFGYSGGDRDKADTTSVLTGDQQMLKFFFSKGLDAYRFIVNDEYGLWAPLYPAKIYPHNDEVDFQMGEAEWRGGNILNGGWKCWMDVDYN
jgi:transglutaminase-like putative cysteine protease